jgi:CDP-paratose 2-epimerase
VNEACYFFKNLGFRIVGIDNDMRKYFFGDKSSTSEKKDKTQKDLGDAYFHYDSDIRDLNLMEKILMNGNMIKYLIQLIFKVK